VGPIDVFIDEDVAYVEELNAHGMACELLPKEGWGFQMMLMQVRHCQISKKLLLRSTQKIKI
jgi:hypothetical protein